MSDSNIAKQEETQTHYRTCNVCEAMCGLVIEHKGEEIISIKGDKEDPLSQGHICPKGVALQDFYHDKDRLTHPLRRTNDGWKEISWEDAYSEIEERFTQIQTEGGHNALGTYLGNPNAHNMGNLLFISNFLRGLKTKNRYSSASADQLPHHVASNYMFGNGMIIPIPDIDRTMFMLIIGGNPMVSNGSMMTAPGYGKRLKALKKRGGKLIVVDPRRTETADMADDYIAIKPNRDALLLAGMVHTLFDESLIKNVELCDEQEIENLKAKIGPFSPEKIATALDIDAEKVRKLTREMAGTDSAVCYSRMGASTQEFGGICQWLTNVLNILTGNIDRPGGAMFTQPAFDPVAAESNSGKPNSYGKYKSRVRSLPFFNGEFPVSTLADEILTEGEGQIKGMITIAGNPVLSSPNGARLAGALSKLDFMVSIDIYLNETTQYADIILPATSGLQLSHYDVVFNQFSVRNTAKYSEALFGPKGEQKPDWKIFKELGARLANRKPDVMVPDLILDMMLKSGPYGKEGMSLDYLKSNPRGVDLGALNPCLKARIQTQNGLINIAPELFLADMSRLEERVRESKTDNALYPFEMISRRLARSHNTWTQNSNRLVKGKNPCTMKVNPIDATSLGIQTGEFVSVSSAVGEIKIEAEVSDEMMQGVVSIPHGWGHNQPDTKMTIASGQPGVSINDLTNETVIDELTGNAVFSGVKVSIKAL